MTIDIEQYVPDLQTCTEIARYADITDERWHELRLTGFGGSDAAACMSSDPYSSRFVKWAEKTGRVSTFEGNEATEMGTLMEPYIRSTILPDYLRQRFPGREIDVVDPVAMYRSNAYSHMILNVDGFLLVDGKLVGLEIKNHGAMRLREYGGVDGDDVPDGYYWQAQHGMAVTGLDEWWHFAIVGGQRRILRIIPRNQELIDKLIAAESDLWELVELNDLLYAPSPAGTDSDMSALLQLSTPQTDYVADLSESEGLLNEYKDYSDWEKEAKEQKEAVKQRIIRHLGQCRTGESGNYRVSFSRHERASFDVKRFRRDYPQLADEYTTWTESSRLSVKRRDG